MSEPTIEEFLRARIEETRRSIQQTQGGFRARADVNHLAGSLLMVIEWHKNWPILVETPEEFLEPAFSPSMDQIAFQVQKKIMWLTNDEYRKRFGKEPPTAPLLRQMAQQFKWHPDYREEWDL